MQSRIVGSPCTPGGRRAVGAGAGRWRSNRRIGVAVALLATAAYAQPSAPGLAVLSAAETARTTVVGRVVEVVRLDRTGYAATVQVERVLSGDARPGAAVRIGWEELGGARQPRLAAGQRVLIALDELPAGSLWRQRFPPDSHALTLAAHGDAWLADPPAADLDLLAAYLQLGPRPAAAARASALARIVSAGAPVLAAAALARLASMPDAETALDANASDLLMHTAADVQKPLTLRRDIITFAGRRRLTAATARLEVLSRGGPPLAASALVALGEIRGGLPPGEVEDLLDSQDAELRAVGARFASGAIAERRLPPLVRGDPVPLVRAAAAEALAGTRTAWGVDGAVPALADPDPVVRSSAAEALGALGAPVVPALDAVARTQPAAARGAITALARAGPTGVAAVRRLMDDHPDAHLRAFARLALGQGPRPH
jgi:hypothetical protein